MLAHLTSCQTYLHVRDGCIHFAVFASFLFLSFRWISQFKVYQIWWVVLKFDIDMQLKLDWWFSSLILFFCCPQKLALCFLWCSISRRKILAVILWPDQNWACTEGCSWTVSTDVPDASVCMSFNMLQQGRISSVDVGDLIELLVKGSWYVLQRTKCFSRRLQANIKKTSQLEPCTAFICHQ